MSKDLAVLWALAERSPLQGLGQARVVIEALARLDAELKELEWLRTQAQRESLCGPLDGQPALDPDVKGT